MPWQAGITEGTIGGVAAKVIGKSAIQYNLVIAGEPLGGRGCKAKIRGRAVPRAWDPAFIRTSNAASGSLLPEN
jgi:hypothetical protein